MTHVLAMFPGQGSQYVGMGKALLASFPQAELVFEEAEDAISLNIRKLCLEGPDSELKLTANTQPCILTHSVAVWRVLENETGLKPTCFAGHSLGEYSALVAAGRLNLERAVFLVRRRGQAMQDAVPEGVGAMAAVMNCPSEDLQVRCEQASDRESRVEVVNFNSPQQLVVAGHKSAVERLCTALQEDGVRTVPLAVSAPFHSSLMKPAKEAMTPLLTDTVFENNHSKIIANLTGKVEVDYDAKFLIDQIDSPVRWTQTLETAHGDEKSEAFVEVGPGRVLFGLARRTLPKGLKLINTEDIRKAIDEVQALLR